MRANSRDDPTPFEISCTKTAGCLYKNLFQNTSTNTEVACGQDHVARKKEQASESRDFLCTHEGWSATLVDRRLLMKNTTALHAFRPRPCGDGGDPDKLYDKHKAYYEHMQLMHSARSLFLSRLQRREAMEERQQISAPSPGGPRPAPEVGTSSGGAMMRKIL